ncbi:unnamed protein product [Phytophthora fragariaefolia]|uniref:Unnamed protein product n=1 Tax=Phytophthora fragariaefolia TaxID=1490495 RepID=A0A9W6TRP1_9STRA|nr:unnamed protein product [Phytophthora fragariaefolia]
MHLFEDMLRTIEESTFSPVPVPAEDKLQGASSSTSAKEATEKKKAPSVKKMPAPSQKKKDPTEKNSIGAETDSIHQPKRSAAKRKADTISKEKARLKSAPVVTKSAASNGHKTEAMRNSKRKAAASTGKENQDKKQEPSRNNKRQKCETPQQATSTVPTKAKSRSGEKKRAPTPEELPLFRDLELDDGTVLDFSGQREDAREKREAMQSFLDKCAVIWKKQLSTISVQ